ncbi:MAG: tRNA lysidine(34) synthetase TilS [Actinobacteria bacterium]|nr:tRNA lysidine(34) synthetase TilS [Actinomycetota bacterium]
MPPATLRRPPAVARVLQQVTNSARGHSLFEPGSLVVAAVSGGPDSLCLLHALVRLRRLLRIRLACFHFDHRLRVGSRADAIYVRNQARRVEVPFLMRTAETAPRRGDSVEAWARTARYEALRSVMEEIGSGRAALGHTADDQAETVLLALVRGGGLSAISGMEPLSGPLARPLLHTTREETEGFCRSLGLRPRRDPANQDPAHLRVAVRTGVIPLLEARLGRNVRTSIVRSAELLRRDARLLDELAMAALPGVVSRQGEDVVLHAGRLSELPDALASRVARRVLLGEAIAPEAEHVAGLLRLAVSRSGSRVSLPEGLRARREREYVRVSRPSPKVAR